MDPGLIRQSRFLSLVLRHRPEMLGLTLDPAGWTGIEELLDACRRQGRPIDRETLDRVVAENDKKRFAISEDGLRIRASQGHSVDVELGYEPAVPPEFLWHGTPETNLPSIRGAGLRRGSRHHVHLSADPGTARTVGDRRGSAAVLEVRSGEMSRAGIAFYRSANGVWLTAHVPPEYIGFPGGPLR